MEPYLDPYPTTNYLAPWNMLKPLLQCILNCIYYQHNIEQMELEHVWDYQLFHLDKTQFIILYFCQYLGITAILNQRTPWIGSNFNAGLYR